MGVCQSRHSLTRNDIITTGRSQPNLQLGEPNPMQFDKTLSDKISNITVTDSQGVCYSLSTLLEDPCNDEKLLFKSQEKNIDRRCKACDHCIRGFPSNCIGAVKAVDNFRNVQTSSTAFMISPQLALTSAHTFLSINPQTNQPIILRPRMMYVGLIGKCVLNNTNNFNPNHFLKVEDFKINQKFIDTFQERWKIKQDLYARGYKMSKVQLKEKALRLHQNMLEAQECDYAIIKTAYKAPIKQYFRLKVVEEEIINQDVTVQGYVMSQTDQEDFVCFNQYYHTDSVVSVSKNTINYNVDTRTQQSGSPVMYETPTGQVYAVGIHKGYNQVQKCNIATKVTHEMIEMIKKWSQLKKIQYQTSYSEIAEEEIHHSETFRKVLKKTIQKKEKQWIEERQVLRLQCSKVEQRLRGEIQQNSARLKEIVDKEKKIERLMASLHDSQRISPKQLHQQVGNPEGSGKAMSLTEKLTWDEKSAFSDRFEIENSIVRLKENQQKCQIVSSRPLGVQQTIKFRVIAYGGETAVIFGLVTQQRVKERCSGEQMNSIGLISLPKHRKGAVKVNGVMQKAYCPQMFIKQGQEVVFNIDFNEVSLTISKQKSVVATITLPDNFINSKVYFYAMMASAKDTAEIVSQSQ